MIRGIVELLTNSYESYKRLERELGHKTEKYIKIIIKNPRSKENDKQLIIIDHAEGMSLSLIHI